ncbi:response regulator [bacterium]|nr:response regulator [bacterium]
MNAVPENILPSVLLVDDDELVLEVMVDQLSAFCHCSAATDGHRALEMLEKGKFDVVVSDQVMPRMSGDELLASVYQRWPHVQRILITGYADLTSVIRAVNRGKITHYLSKPWTALQLVEAVQAAHQIVMERRAQTEQYVQASKERGQALQALEEGRQFLHELVGLRPRPGLRAKSAGKAKLLRAFSQGEPALIEPCDLD